MVERQESKKLEFKLSATVTALVDAVEDVSGTRPPLGVVHLEKGKATIADGFVLVQVEDEGILLGGALDIPFSVLKPHHKKDVTVTVSGNGTGVVSVAYKPKKRAYEVEGVTYKTETCLPTTVYPNVAHLIRDALGNTYSACTALDVSKIKRLLRLFNALQERGKMVRFYIPTNPMQPMLLTMDEGHVKAILMPMFVQWNEDGIKKEAAEGIKYEEERES